MLLLLGAGPSSGMWLPTKATGASLYQWLYDGHSTPIEQTSAITGSPMTVVNSRAGTGDRRELRQGRVAQGDGAADRGNFTGPTLSGDWTFGLRVKVTSGDTGIWMDIGDNWYIKIGLSSKFQLDPNALSDGRVSSDTAPTVGQWYSVIITHDMSGPLTTMYVDGVAQSNTDSEQVYTPSTAMGLLARAGGISFSSAPIREAFIYSDLLTTGEISAISDSSDFHTDNLEFLYWGEEEVGGIGLDASGNGRNITFTGTLADIHQPDTGVTYSAANSLGHSAASLKATADTVAMCHLAEEVPFNVGHTIALDVLTDSTANIILSNSAGTYNFYKNGSNVKWTISNNIGTDAAVNVSKTWQRYAIRRNSSDNKFTVYLNGVDITNAGQSAVAGSSALYHLGGWKSASVQFQGQMRRVRRWTSELSDADMAQASTFGGTVSETPANEWPLGGRTDDLYGGIPVVYSSDATTTVIPRDESDTTVDVNGDTLQNSSEVQYYAKVIQSGALQGDGAADYVTIPVGVANALKGATNATAVMWFKRPSSNAECFITLGNLNYRFAIMVYTGNVIYAVAEAGGSASYGSVSYADTTEWHCAVMRFRGGETGNANRLQLWIDGVNQTLSFTGTVPAALENSSQLETGRYLLAEWNGNPGNGLQGLSALYSDAWTEQEIADHYDSLAMPTDNVVAVYPCSEINPAETTVYDVSGNERHGTISGTTADVRAGRQDVIAWNQLHGFSKSGSTYIPGFNGLKPDGVTATDYAPGATADVFHADGSQLDRSGGVTTPLARNVNAIDTSYEVGDGQINPEFVRETTTQADRFLAYSETLTGSNLTNAAEYTSLAPFDPTIYGTATHWWNQDSGIYSDAGSTPVVDNDPVYQWNDAIGSAHVIQATEANRPLYLSSSAGIDFDGSNDVLSYTSSIGNVGAVAIVLTLDSNGSGLDTVFELFTNQNASFRLASATTFSDANAADFSQYVTATDEGDIFINTVEGVTFTQNQKFVVTLSRKNSAIGSSRIDIGSSILLPTRSLSGQVHEMVVWSNLVSDADLRRAATALMAKHNII